MLAHEEKLARVLERIRQDKEDKINKKREYKRDYKRNRYNTDPEVRKKQNVFNTKYRFKRFYGMTIEERDAMLAAQGGCAICRTSKTTKWCIDHCHITGKVRGILCHHCNTMLGLSRDDPQVLQAAITYLRR